MSQVTTESWTTAIAEVRDDDVIVRGERLSSLIGEFSVPEAAFLVATGRRATDQQARVIEALMVSVMEHGISPSTMVSRQMASYGVPIQVGVAAGQLTVGDFHGGAGEEIADTMGKMTASATSSGPERLDELRRMAADHVKERRASGQAIGGFGHPQHGADPRARILLDIGRECDVYGDNCYLLECIEDELSKAVGRHVPVNIDGAAAGLFLDLGIDPRLTRPLMMMTRVVSLGAHFVEEIDQGGKFRHAPGHQVTYTGQQPL